MVSRRSARFRSLGAVALLLSANSLTLLGNRSEGSNGMKIRIRNQRSHLSDYLSCYTKQPLSFESTKDFPVKKRRTAVCNAQCNKSLEDYEFDFLFQFDVFPDRILESFGEWQLSGRMMERGDVIVLQNYLPPVRWGLKLICAVRVLSVFRTRARTGFSYGTLRGHPETGTNEFTFLVENGEVIAEIITQSKPGTILTRIGSPLTKAYAEFCNGRALDRMKSQFVHRNLRKSK
jgi:hypothetical protein